MKPLPRLLSFMATIMAILLITLSTFAGSTSIRDNVGLLSAADRDQLLTTGFQWPFDATVLIENVEKDTLRAHASSQVTAPNMVVIALSPTKRSTVVRFGSGTNVDQGHWESIAKADNGAFKEDRWRTGIEAIGFRAKVAVEEARLSVAAPQRPQTTNLPVHEQNAITAMWMAIGLTAVFFAALAWWMVRRHRRQTDELQAAADKLSCEAADIASKTITMEERREREKWEGVERGEGRGTETIYRRNTSRPVRVSHDLPRTQPVHVPVQPSAPAPVYTTQTTTVVHERGGGSSDFAMGLLVGDALNDRHSDHHHHHYESPAPPSSRKNYDSGGSSSSWGSVFESNSSSDSGGSGSSWDSSSSSSFDSGGSSSDW